MSWGAPSALYGLWAVPVLLLAVALALRSRRRALSRLGSLVESLSSEGALAVHRARLGILVAVCVLGLIALAQPRWGFRWQELKREGLSLVVVLDVSSSMNAEDVSPSRMERAQRKILDLSDLLAGDRVGLVIFAGGAYPRMPLTLDYDALRQMVRNSDTQTLTAQGSDLGAAIEAAVKLLGEQTSDSADRVILVVSDGEDQNGQAEAAAKAAYDKGIHLYALGVGTAEGAPIPLPEGGFKKDNQGQVVLTKLNEDTLLAIASAGQGAYVRASAGAGDVRALYEDEIRGKLKAAEQGVRRDKIWDERYQWPLGLALLLGLASAAVRPGPLRLRSGPVVALLLFPLLLGEGAKAATNTAESDPVVQDLLARQVEHPDDLHVGEQLGEALFKAGDYARAEEVLTGVAERSKDALQRSRARYNAGLAAYRNGRLTEALEDWNGVLRDLPKHEAATQNAAAVQKELAQRLQRQPPQPNQDQQNQDQQNQDQQNPDQQNQDQQDQQNPDQQNQDQQNQSANQQNAKPSSDGTRPEMPKDTGTESAQAQQAENPDDTGAAEAATSTDGQPQLPGSISKAEAERLIKGVEEGDPRVTVKPSSRGGKDW